MNFYMNRFCEAVIVVVIVLFGVHWLLERERKANFEQQSLDRFQVLNRALWEHYGPGSIEAYEKVFSIGSYSEAEPDDLYSKEKWDTLSEIEELTEMAGVSEGILGVDEAPEWFRERLDLMDNYIRVLDRALEKGPYLAAPDEAYSRMHYVKTPSNTQQVASLLRHEAMRKWHRGEHQEAIKNIKRIFAFSDAFRYSPALVSHLIRFVLYDIALEGMSRFLWLEPNMEDLKSMHAALYSTDFWEWEVPDYADAFLWMDGFRSDYDLLSALYLQLPADSFRRDDARMLQEAGILPRFKLTPYKAASIAAKWTTIPAMKKRAEHLPDEFFARYDFLKPEDAKKLPVLGYMASRYLVNPFGLNELNIKRRLERIQDKMALLRMAVWARLFQEEHGEFASEKQLQEYLKESMPEVVMPFQALHDLSGVQMLRGTFQQIHQTTTNLSHAPFGVPNLDQWDARKIHYLIGYPPGYFRNNQWVSDRTGLRSDTIKYYLKYRERGREEYIEATRDELIDWTRGIFEAFKPIVKSSTLSYSTGKELMNILLPGKNTSMQTEMNTYIDLFGSYSAGVYYERSLKEGSLNGFIDPSFTDKKYPFFLTVELDLPKTSYWLAHPGPNKVMDSHPSYYAPSNGLTSAGNVYQLIGWE